MKEEPIIHRRVNVILDGSVHNRLRHEAINRNEPMALIIETALTEHFNKGDSSNGDKQ